MALAKWGFKGNFSVTSETATVTSASLTKYYNYGDYPDNMGSEIKGAYWSVFRISLTDPRVSLGLETFDITAADGGEGVNGFEIAVENDIGMLDDGSSRWAYGSAFIGDSKCNISVRVNCPNQVSVAGKYTLFDALQERLNAPQSKSAGLKLTAVVGKGAWQKWRIECAMVLDEMPMHSEQNQSVVYTLKGMMFPFGANSDYLTMSLLAG